MKILKFIIVTVIFLFSTSLLFSNEIANNKTKKKLSFSFVEDCKQNSINLLQDKLAEKGMDKYGLSGSKQAMVFFYMFIAGAVVGTLGLCVLVPAAVILTLAALGRLYVAGPYGSLPLIIGSSVALAIGATMFLAGSIVFIVGLVLFFYYGGKFAMYSEPDYDNARLNTGFSIKL